MNTLESALQIALDAHRGQKDLDGMPVVLHPLRVGMAGKTEKKKGIFEKHQKALRMITQTRIESAREKTGQQGKSE